MVDLKRSSKLMKELINGGVGVPFGGISGKPPQLSDVEILYIKSEMGRNTE
jgi:hypothetical protein